MKFAVSSFAVLFAALITTSAWAEGVESGLPVGSQPPAFHVTDVTGPSAGDSLCYRCQYGNSPVVAIFTRELTTELGSLVQQVDEMLVDNEDANLKAFVVYLSDDSAGAGDELTAFAEEYGITNTPLTTYANATGPESYQLSSDAGVTVLLWSESEVQANSAFAPGSLDKDGSDTVLAATETMIQ